MKSPPQETKLFGNSMQTPFKLHILHNKHRKMQMQGCIFIGNRKCLINVQMFIINTLSLVMWQMPLKCTYVPHYSTKWP